MNKIAEGSVAQRKLVFGVLRVVSGGGGTETMVPCIGTSKEQIIKYVLQKWAGDPEIEDDPTWLSEEEFRKVLPESRALNPCISFVEMSGEAMTLPGLRPEEFDRR